MRGYEAPFGNIGKVRHRQLRIPMRGYENDAQNTPKITGQGYESPCGVMSGLFQFAFFF